MTHNLTFTRVRREGWSNFR